MSFKSLSRFEALEYAGILKEARSSYNLRSTKGNEQLIGQARDYLLRTMDGLRTDIRTHLHPQKVKRLVQESMERDKPGTVGFGTGAFLGFIL